MKVADTNRPSLCDPAGPTRVVPRAATARASTLRAVRPETLLLYLINRPREEKGLEEFLKGRSRDSTPSRKVSGFLRNPFLTAAAAALRFARLPAPNGPGGVVCDGRSTWEGTRRWSRSGFLEWNPQCLRAHPPALPHHGPAVFRCGRRSSGRFLMALAERAASSLACEAVLRRCGAQFHQALPARKLLPAGC
jgi:hypothetical protein